MSAFGGSPKCPACAKSVFFNEQVKALGRTWHKTCFACGTCKKSLHSGTACDNGGQPYCKPCYAKGFGPKGYGYGGGAGVLTDTGISATGVNAAPGARPMPAAPALLVQGGSAASGGRSNWSGRQAKPSARAPPSNAFGGAPKCPVCTKSVYAAEQVKALSQTFHKTCFACQVCKKSLHSADACDNEGLPYCKADYAKLFGPKGYGFGGGAGVLTNTGISRAKLQC